MPQPNIDPTEPRLPSFGFKAYILKFYPPRRPSEEIPVDAPGWGEGGLHGALGRLIEAVIADSAGRDDRKSTFTAFESYVAGGQLVLLRAAGGVFGQTADVVDTASGAKKGAIGLSDAVLHAARCVFVTPPTGTLALLMAESIGGRRSSAQLVLGRMKNRLIELGAVARAEHDVADGHAWADYLDGGEADVRAIELIQTGPAGDRTPIAADANVRSSKITINLSSGGSIRQMMRALSAGVVGRQRLSLAPVVGLGQWDDDDFDEQRVVIVKDGRQRTINVTTGWPSFYYEIDRDLRPEDPEFVSEACNAASALLADLDVDMPRNWRTINLGTLSGRRSKNR